MPRPMPSGAAARRGRRGRGAQGRRSWSAASVGRHVVRPAPRSSPTFAAACPSRPRSTTTASRPWSWTTRRSTPSPWPGWFELADVVRSLGDDPAVRVLILAADGRGYNAGVDIKEMQATEGYEALIGANKGCYAAFAAVYECAVPGDRRRPRLLPRRGHRPGRQRRHHHRLRRRHLRPARGGPGRARGGHPPGPPGAPAQDAGDGLHLGRGHGRGAAPLRQRPPGRAPGRAAGRRPGGRRGDRGQEPDGHPGRQGVPQRDRPGRRQAVVPLRAGLHLRAEPGRGRRRGPGRLRGHGRERRLQRHEDED